MRARRFCAWCAAPLGPVEGSSQRCAACGETLYLNAAPCVAVLVRDDRGRVLLARRAIEPRAGLWDTPGGFLEPFETPEQAAVRELAEEAGVEIEVERLLAHLPDVYGDDGDPTLAAVVTARITAGRLVAADDVAELAWFALDALPPRAEIAFPSTAAALALRALGELGEAA